VLVAALDTATLVLSCALVDLEPGAPPRLRCERTEHAPAKGPASAERRRHRAEGGPTRPPGGHGARLPGALSDLLVAEGLKLPDVEGYAIGLGPGSFTGLRIGLATWKGLAYANRRPIAGASSLAAMALAARPGVAEGAILVPLLDARKGEVYAGFYRAEGEGIARVAPEAALPPAAQRRSPSARGSPPTPSRSPPSRASPPRSSPRPPGRWPRSPRSGSCAPSTPRRSSPSSRTTSARARRR